ncbi:MAG: hypothetical protein HON90_17290, partial [Halobacteriovoraceae bacterium]|nr:hypothetical protein [Halobacteriovoraceae bacterium]
MKSLLLLSIISLFMVSCDFSNNRTLKDQWGSASDDSLNNGGNGFGGDPVQGELPEPGTSGINIDGNTDGSGDGDTNTNGPGDGDTNTNGPGDGDTNTNGPGDGDTNTNGPGDGDTNTNGPGDGDTSTNGP